MNRTILADVDGFTPVIDMIVRDCGLMSAVVFGRVWRFCQMESGVCSASLEKISETIGIDRATAMRHIKDLCEVGYLKDLTPDLRNHPHTYADTGKASLRIGISSVAQSNVIVAESNTSVAQSKLKKEKKDFKEIAAAPLSSETFLEFEKLKAGHEKEGWLGRELFRNDHWIYADWWYSITGQPAKGNKSQVRSCQKAFNDWGQQGLGIISLQQAYDARMTWKKFISDPNEITKDAAAIQALPPEKPKTEQESTDDYNARVLLKIKQGLGVTA